MKEKEEEEEMQSNIGWDEQTVIRKNNTGPRVARDKATVNAAMRSGDLSTEKKCTFLFFSYLLGSVESLCKS